MTVLVSRLADWPHLVPELASGIQREWPGWYRHPDDALNDLRNRCRRDGLPVGLVAVESGIPVGCIALEATSTKSHRYLSPWVAGLWVDPRHRHNGIAGMLLSAACDHARQMGFAELFAASARQRSSRFWRRIDRGITEGGELVDIMRVRL